MKLKSLSFALCVLVAAVFRLAAQQTETERKQFEATKAKAENGDAIAQNSLGLSYTFGQGVAKNEVEGVKWYRKAAEQNYASAQFGLGFLYFHGEGVAQDYIEAVKWYRKAAEQNYAPAEYLLGACYHEGTGLTKDDVEAVKWYRKAAEQNYAPAESVLGAFYHEGTGLTKDDVEAVKWYRNAAEQNYAGAQYNLGFCYRDGQGVAKDDVEAVKWFRKSAEQGFGEAENVLGWMYEKGHGVLQDYAEAVRWYRKAAEQGDAAAQFNLGASYAEGDGVPRNYIEAYKWQSLAASQGDDRAKRNLSIVEMRMTPEQVAEAQRLAAAFVPREETKSPSSDNFTSPENPTATGTGFFITDDGYLISNCHVVKDAAQVRLRTSAGLISAKVLKVDAANDLALLKAEGRFAPLPITSSRAVKLGGTVATVGFPDIGLQGFAPKFARGEIASLSGAGDDARYFQISAPVQPGNSGGALVDEHGNVVGVVSAKLNASAALAASGALPENVNYAVKSSFLLSFLESVPEVSVRLKEPISAERKFDDVVQAAKAAAVLVLVY
jgi:TPR repeat protein